jgi:hypothetical protein
MLNILCANSEVIASPVSMTLVVLQESAIKETCHHGSYRRLRHANQLHLDDAGFQRTDSF